jgi:hypothetical protein
MTNGAGSGGLRRFAHGLGAALCLALSVMLGTHSGVPFRLVAEPFCGGFAIATLLAIATAQVAALANTATLCGTVWPERAGTILTSQIPDEPGGASSPRSVLWDLARNTLIGANALGGISRKPLPVLMADHRRRGPTWSNQEEPCSAPKPQPAYYFAN